LPASNSSSSSQQATAAASTGAEAAGRAKEKISNGKSGLPENLPLPVVSEKRISV